MAATPPEPSATDPDWNKGESFGSAFLQIFLAALVLGGGLFLYYRHTQTKKQVYALAKDARDSLTRDNPKDLLEAKAKFAKALALDSTDPYSVSANALAEVLLVTDYGVKSEESSAASAVEQAKKVNAPLDEDVTAQALWLIHQGNVQGADAYISGIKAKGSLPPGLANALGRIRHGQGKLDEARALLKKAADIAWRSPRFAADLAQTYFDDGDFINAELFYNKALKTSSQHLRSMIGLDRARIARGQDVKKASDDLDSILALPASDTSPTLLAQAHTAQSELRRFEQKYDQAAKLADQAVADDPAYAWAYAAKGAALADAKKDAAGAATAFDKAIALDAHVGQFYVQAAQGLAGLKDQTKADGYMAGYAKNLKVDDRYHLVYGDLLKGLGNLDKAQTEYQAAIKANGFNAKAHYALGTVLVTQKKDDDASKEFLAALAAQHNFPEAQEALGNIKFAKKAYADALEDFANALVQMKQANVDRAKIDALLDQVTHRLDAAKQKAMAKAWVEQAKQLVR